MRLELSHDARRNMLCRCAKHALDSLRVVAQLFAGTRLHGIAERQQAIARAPDGFSRAIGHGAFDRQHRHEVRAEAVRDAQAIELDREIDGRRARLRLVREQQLARGAQRGAEFLPHDALDDDVVLREEFEEAVPAGLAAGLADDRAQRAEHEARAAPGSEVEGLGRLGDVAVDERDLDRPAVGAAQFLGRRGATRNQGRKQKRQKCLHHSTLAPEARITGAQRSVSSLMKAANCCGVMAVALDPPAAYFSCISAVAMARWIAAESFSTMEGGVAAGKATPCQDMAWKPGTVSAIVGMSGAVNQRSDEVTAIGRTLPPRAWAMTVGMLPKVIATCPPITSVSAGPPPL